MTNLHATYAAIFTVPAVIVVLAWLLAGFLLLLANDGGDITDKPIRDVRVVRPFRLEVRGVAA